MACICQTRTSALSAVTRWPPVAVKRTASPASSAEPGLFQGDAAARDEQVQERRLGQLHALAGPQPGHVQRGVPVLDPDGGGAVVFRHAGGDGHQAAGEQFVVDLELLVAGIDAALVRHDPHLHEVHRVAMRDVILPRASQPPGVVLLAVQDAGARAHPLGQARVDHPRVALGVLVHQRALQHPGDDLHVLVRMGLEAGARLDDVVVVDQQQPVVGVGPVVVTAEAEAVLAVQPAQAGLEPLVGAADVDLRGQRGGHVGSFTGRRSGVLDRGDLELEGDLVADQDAAGLRARRSR